MGCHGEGSKWKLWDHTVDFKVLRNYRCDISMSSDALYHKGIIFHQYYDVFLYTTVVIMVFTVKTGCKFVAFISRLYDSPSIWSTL